MPNPFQRHAGTIYVETLTAGTLMSPDGRHVYAVSNYTTAPSDGRPLRTGSSTAPTDGSPRIAISLYAAGTLVTADGRPVYAMSGAESSPYADSSYALALDFDDGEYWAGGTQYGATEGAEMVANGGFADATGWTTAGGWSISGGQAVGTSATDYLGTSLALVSGKTYRLTFDYTMTAGSKLRLEHETPNSLLYTTPVLGASGTITHEFKAEGVGLRFEADGAVFTGTIDNVSCKEIAGVNQFPGYTFTRSGAKGEVNALTGADRIDEFAANVPAIVPGVGYYSRSALTNLLLRSNEFDSAPWDTQLSLTITANAAAAPDGTTTADRITFSNQFGNRRQLVSVAVGKNTFSFWAKRESGNTALAFFHEQATAVITEATFSAFTVTDDWARHSVTVDVTTAGTVRFGVQDRNASGFGSVLVWNAQVLAGTHPDGGPIIETAGTTAAIGEDLLLANDAVGADADQLFIAKGAISKTTDGQIMEWSDSSTNNWAFVYLNGANLRAQVRAAAVTVYSPTLAYTAGVESTFVLRRLGGNWRFGVIQSGVITWASADTAGAFPTTMSKVCPGNYFGGGFPADDNVRFVGRKLGSFATDAAVLAVAAEIA